jgi:hypothetical protein
MNIDFDNLAKTIIYTSQVTGRDLKDVMASTFKEIYEIGYNDCKNTDWWREQDAEKSK